MPIKCGIAPMPRPAGRGLRSGYSGDSAGRQSTTGAAAPFATDHAKRETSSRDYHVAAVHGPAHGGRRTRPDPHRGAAGFSPARQRPGGALCRSGTTHAALSQRNILTGHYDAPTPSSVRIVEPGGAPARAGEAVCRTRSVGAMQLIDKSPDDHAGDLRMMRGFGKHTAPNGYQGRRRADVADKQIERSTAEARSVAAPVGPVNASWLSSPSSALPCSKRTATAQAHKAQDTSVGARCRAVKGANGGHVLYVR